MSSNDYIIKLYKSRKVILNLHKRQDYNVLNYENFSINEVNEMYQNKQLDILLENDITNQKVYIKYYLGKTLGQNNLYEFIDDLYNLDNILKKDDKLIIIMKDDPNSTMIETLINIWEKDKIFVIIFNIKHLQFNILDHTLVPNHIVLNNEQTKMFKTKYNITQDHEIPQISRFDPVAKVIGIIPGQICKIIRPSNNSIESIYYRICS